MNGGMLALNRLLDRMAIEDTFHLYLSTCLGHDPNDWFTLGCLMLLIALNASKKIGGKRSVTY